MSAENPADAVIEQAARAIIDRYPSFDLISAAGIARALRDENVLADPADRDEPTDLDRFIEGITDPLYIQGYRNGYKHAKAERAEDEVARLNDGWCPCADGRPQDCTPEDWPLSDRHGLPARLRDALAEWDELAKENAGLRATIDQVRQLADEWQPSSIQSPHWAAVRLRALLIGAGEQR